MFNGNFINLLIYRSAAELKSEGTRTYAGYLWWILEPLMSLAVYYIAFKYIFHKETENFALFLFVGIILYRFFSGTVTRSAVSITGAWGLTQLVYVHKSIFPLSVVLVNLVKFGVTFVLVLSACWIAGLFPNRNYLLLPMLFALLLVVTAGTSMICAAITPFFPDFQLILNTVMHLLIFLSGVFYDLSSLSPKLEFLLSLNPLAVIIDQFRRILLQGEWIGFQPLISTGLESLLLLAVGWFLVHKYDRCFPKIS